MIECKTDLAAAIHLAKEGRLEEFVGREKQIPHDANYHKALAELYREFGILVLRTEERHSGFIEIPPLSKWRPEIFK